MRRQTRPPLPPSPADFSYITGEKSLPEVEYVERLKLKLEGLVD